MNEFDKIMFGVLAFLGTARATRLLVFDSFPPAGWVRAKWDDLTEDTGWNDLAHCAYCLAPWLMLTNLAWAWIVFATDVNDWAWWGPNLWFALSYLAAIVVAYDGDDSV